MKVRVTNNGRSPRGIHDSSGHRIVTIAPGETREMDMTEAQVMRYRAKIAGGDSLELVEPLGKEAPKFPAAKPAAAKPAEAPAPAPAQTGKKRGPKPKAKAEPEAAPAPATDSLEALQARAAELKIPGFQNYSAKRLKKEIARAEHEANQPQE